MGIETMVSRSERLLQVGSGWFDPVSCELSLDGNSTRLRPRSAALLTYLLTHTDRVIGKDELLQAIWPKVVVTEDSLVQCVKEIRRALGRARHDWIRTVPREGYAFVAPSGDISRISSTPTGRFGIAIVAIALTGLAVALVSGLNRPDARPPLSLVVLPFDNLTGNPARENDVDELTERLAESLSRVPGAFVIAPSTAFTFKGQTVDVRRVGSDLGVRYVLEGALRQKGDLLQLNVRMADSTRAAQLWSEAFETPAQSASDLRLDVATLVAGSLGLRLISADAEHSQRERTVPDAIDLLVRARAALRWAGQGEEGVARARQLLEQAVRQDEGLAEAWALLAWTYAMDTRIGASSLFSASAFGSVQPLFFQRLIAGRLDIPAASVRLMRYLLDEFRCQWCRLCLWKVAATLLAAQDSHSAPVLQLHIPARQHEGRLHADTFADRRGKPDSNQPASTKAGAAQTDVQKTTCTLAEQLAVSASQTL